MAQPDSLIGSVLGGRYEIVTRVNRGGTAVVYRGIDRRLGRTVAVKVIHSDLSSDPEYVTRFDREARAAAILSHPNIVAVFDQGRAGDRPYIVMEFIHGQSLRSIISSSAPLPPALALSYADEIAKALAAAHDAGLIHRDIKPENVLITNDGQVKVTDFGLAKTAANPTTTASQGRLMGTMSYIAPEIPQTGAASKASDIYSTGVVMYEMLTGKKPHVGEDLSHVLYKHVHEDIRPPSQALAGQARARIPDYVDALVTACTSRNSDLRPANGRVLEEKIAKARRSLDAGLLHDAGLVKEFSAGPAPAEPTPVLDSTAETVAAPVIAAVPAVPAKAPEPPATKLAKAAPSAQQKKLATAKPAQDSRRRRKRALVTGIAGVVVLAIIALVVCWFTIWRWSDVPTLTGLTEQTARTQIADRSLTLTTLQEYSDTVPSGQIIRTDPQAGTRLRKGSTVTAYISKGKQPVDVVSYVGKTQDTATQGLQNAGFQVSVTQQNSTTVPVGTVISQDPDSGQAFHGDTITLVVSKGIDVVSQAGQTQDAATEALTAAGFKVTTSQDKSSTVPVGSVISQDPSSGQADPGATINLVISTGADIPSCIGQTQADATAALTAAGFKVATTQDYSTTVPAGSVMSQSPAQAIPGDTITLVISQGPKMIQIPSVTGLSKTAATTKLTDAGFVVESKNVNPLGSPLNIAYNTTPAAGQMAAEGSTVTLNYM